ncbi:MAG: hypothetical protein OER86_07500 [Phycisphaerae bacterium]|nr:hypothetical protein [Phycisphaerae bacterium]
MTDRAGDWTNAPERPLTGPAGGIDVQTRPEVTEDWVLRNMSPEMATRAMTSREADFRTARTIDTNTRSIWDDLGRILLLDRPFRGGETPIP